VTSGAERMRLLRARRRRNLAPIIVSVDLSLAADALVAARLIDEPQGDTIPGIGDALSIVLANALRNIARK
jgi:hypothetical protein